jgi:hypothetical protein
MLYNFNSSIRIGPVAALKGHAEETIGMMQGKIYVPARPSINLPQPDIVSLSGKSFQ